MAARLRVQTPAQIGNLLQGFIVHVAAHVCNLEIMGLGGCGFSAISHGDLIEGARNKHSDRVSYYMKMGHSTCAYTIVIKELYICGEKRK